MAERTYVQSVMRRCVHFSGISQPACRAGVAYETVEDPKPNGGYRLPCFADDGARTACEHARFPTREEAEERERESHASTRRINLVRAAIVTATEGKRGVAGTIACPACEGGTVRFSVAGYNGHIWGKCSTPHCAEWVE
jgi:hypothetical protein